MACKGTHEGPWQRSRGHEVGIIVKGLGMGELIILEGVGTHPVTFLQDGQYPFPKLTTRFRFIKQASLFDNQETFVQVVLSGPADVSDETP